MNQLLEKSEDRQLESDDLNMTSSATPSFLLEASEFGSVALESSRYDFLAPYIMAEIDEEEDEEEYEEEEDGEYEDEEEYEDDDSEVEGDDVEEESDDEYEDEYEDEEDGEYEQVEDDEVEAVSYTHLTLPTILLV